MNREDRQIDKEYPRRDREFMQQIVDMWIPGLKLPPPRTEEEFLTELKTIRKKATKKST